MGGWLATTNGTNGKLVFFLKNDFSATSGKFPLGSVDDSEDYAAG